MNATVNCSLKGQYKVDIYSGKRLVETTDWFSNDITNWGLNYPFDYSFAQCFMFLSLGKTIHSSPNQINTGLADPIYTYQVYNSETDSYSLQSGTYIGWQGYEIGGPHTTSYDGTSTSFCGTKLTKQGVNLYRAWTIPTGNRESNNSVSIGEPAGLSIQQFMVSPSSGSDAKGNKAFSLVDRTIIIPSGYSATITYQLSINFSNYENKYTFFSGIRGDKNGYFETGYAATGISGSELPLLSGWSQLSGIFRQIFPAIQFVDNVGACVSPKIGYDLEPFRKDSPKTSFYLTPDLSQFSVNKSGGSPTTEYDAYNSYGIMANYSDIYGDTELSSNTDTDGGAIFENPNKWYYSGESIDSSQTDEQLILENIRLENLLNIGNYNSGSINNLNYQTKNYVGAKNYPTMFASPGKVKFNSTYSDYGQRVVFSSYLKRLPIDSSITGTGIGGVSNRFKYVTKKSIFSPLSSLGTNSRYGALVLAKNTSNSALGERSLYPYIDFLFFDNEGRGSNSPHYRLIPDIYLSERGSGVAKVRFDITGSDGNKSSAVNRLYSVYGFMGDGTTANPSNTTGLNLNHPLLTAQVDVQYQNYFIPQGPKYSGYLFTGKNLDSNVQGDIYYRGTGWGAVYGIVTNPYYYMFPYDTVLIDNPNWTGFSGGIPNQTGDYSRLYWPYKNNTGFGLRISEMEYYLKGYGNYSDPTDFYANGNYQMIGDITYVKDNLNISLFDITGQGGVAKFYFSTSSSPSQGDLLTNGSLSTITQTFRNIGAVATGAFLPVKTGTDGTYITFSGFDFSNLATSRLSGKNLRESDLTGYYYSGASSYFLSSNHYLVYNNNGTYYSLTDTGAFKVIPTKFKKPSGTIHHVEGVGNFGYRLLPNYGIPNNDGINTYEPVTGGSFPGLSTQNGLEVYLTLTWSGA